MSLSITEPNAAVLPAAGVSAAPTAPLLLPRRRPVTRLEFEHLARIGFFGPDEHVELIEGDIVEKMTQNSPHATAVRRAETVLGRVFSQGFDVRPQLPLALGPNSLPEPDIAVVPGSYDDYEAAHPTTAVLVVEVSDTTLAGDRTIKAGLYARAGIGEYWIVNLPERLLEVYREPVALPGQPLGHTYRQTLRLGDADTVTPLAAPGAFLAVTDLLPRQSVPAPE